MSRLVRFLLPVLALALVPAYACGRDLGGRWTLLPSHTTDTMVLTMQVGSDERSSGWVSREVAAKQVHGVSPDDLRGGFLQGTFEIVRDAGTFRCDGTLKRGKGSGQFVFVPDPRFAQGLAKRGIGTPTADQQFDLGLHDVGLALVDEIARQGYERPSVERLIEMGKHGVDMEYVRGMDRAGYRLPSTAELVRMRDHGVDWDFIQELDKAGYRKLEIDDVLRARDHGVDGDYLAGMAVLGYGRLPLDELVRARDHGVDPEYLRRLARRGVTDLTLERAITMRDRGE